MRNHPASKKNLDTQVQSFWMNLGALNIDKNKN
jgi:hypothetical protein